MSGIQNLSLQLADFVIQRIVNNIPKEACICLVGHFANELPSQRCLLRFSKATFTEDSIRADLKKCENIVLTRDVGENKSEFALILGSSGSAVLFLQRNVTEEEIEYHSKKAHVFWPETVAEYQFTKKYIHSHLDNAKWIKEYLKMEGPEILYRDADPEIGFIIVRDVKWKSDDLQNYYLLVLINRSDIYTLRDLNSTHLPLLHNLHDSINKFLNSTMNVKFGTYRMFFHYLPTYFHLHVHVTTVDYRCISCREHMLCDVIDNIENIDSNYYARKVISTTISTKLLSDIQEYSKQTS